MSTTIYSEKLKKEIILKNYKDFGTEIVIQAVKDYQLAVQRSDHQTIKECESFFRSDWYKLLTDIDADAVMDYARRKTKRIYTR